MFLEEEPSADVARRFGYSPGAFRVLCHACKHRPKASSESGGTQPVPNRGLAAVVLILCLAFILSSAFAILHSKLFRLHHPSLLEIGRQLYRSLWQIQPPIRAPA